MTGDWKKGIVIIISGRSRGTGSNENRGIDAVGFRIVE
jgi:hypothetical protein